MLTSGKPYYYAVIPVLFSSLIGDSKCFNICTFRRTLPAHNLSEYRIRAPIIIFNSLCLIAGFAMLGFADQVTVRYIGTFLATGAYVSNWAALNCYQANNITGYVG